MLYEETLKPVKVTYVKDVLDTYLPNYTDFNSWLIAERYEYLYKYFVGDSCLELGCADGAGTKQLVKWFTDITVIDGSQDAVDYVVEKYGVVGICSYFEDLKLDRKYDTVILAHVLEHVDDPQTVLRVAEYLVAPGGVLIVDVPNADSLHRQMGVKLGLLERRTSLNETDLAIGHQRVYSFSRFKDEIGQLNFSRVQYGGMFLKLLSEKQIGATFDKQQLDALFELGVDNPEIAAEIYAVLIYNNRFRWIKNIRFAVRRIKKFLFRYLTKLNARLVV